jgi:outer membrane protein assembly factor BamD (BamD/ComL family)
MTAPENALDLEALTTAYKRIVSAIDSQSEKLETYSNSPYAEDSGKKLAAASQALCLLGAEIRAWHAFDRERE